MSRTSRGAGGRAVRGHALPVALPRIHLHRGEAMWVLSRLGFQGNASKSRFIEYVKSLRKLGSPFDRGRIPVKRSRLGNYSYYHLMELALVLTVRVYNVVPDVLLSRIVARRRLLHRYYRAAYVNRASGLGAPFTVSAASSTPLTARGVFLDLRINFSGGLLTNFGPPTLLSPCEAISAFVGDNAASRALLPINLSLLAERLVAAALEAPKIQRGRRRGAVVAARTTKRVDLPPLRAKSIGE